MKAVIMAGGFGTRLRPLTTHIPKPLVPVGNVPIMEHTVRLLKRHGFTDLLVLLYFLPETITGYFGDGSRWGVRMTYATPTADLGTAGAVKFAAGDLGEPVLVISGDVLTDFDLQAAVRSHQERGAEASIVLTRVDSPLAYGIVITDESGRIVRFLEKPSWGEVFSDTINTGIYILEPSVLGAIPNGRPYDFGRELFPALLASGRPLYGHVADGYWRDVGDLTEYRAAHLDLLQGRVGVDLPGTHSQGPEHSVWVGEGARVDFLTKLTGSVIIGPGAQVAPGVRLANCVIGPECVIAAGADIEGSVLWDHVDVGPGARVKEAIVGTRASDPRQRLPRGGRGDRRLRAHRRVEHRQGQREGLAVQGSRGRRDPRHEPRLGASAGAGRSSAATASRGSPTSRSRPSSRPSWARRSAPSSASGAR